MTKNGIKNWKVVKNITLYYFSLIFIWAFEGAIYKFKDFFFDDVPYLLIQNYKIDMPIERKILGYRLFLFDKII